jgi:hypothetical protein
MRPIMCTREKFDGANLLTLSGDTTNGFTATLKVNLPITAL